MIVRFRAFANMLKSGFSYRQLPLVLLLMLLCFKPKAQNTAFNTMDELKAEANRLFEDDEYAKCYKLYSQLVSNYPKDPEFNYRLGVCMLYCEPDKKKCFPYFQLAISKPEDTPKDATFFLAKAYHLNYQFDDALKYYNDYKKIGSPNQIKKLQVDKEIKACINGKRLLGSFADLVVLSKKQLNEVDYFRSYDLTSIGGRLLVKPEDFKTSADKKKKDKSVVFLPKGGERVYFSSYGDKLENGRDIYFAIKLPNGTFSKPEKVKGINTEFDEDYPFLHPNGKTLYFSSKGHNSMGGYDIFKSTYNPESDSWSQPVNMEFPINSPDDDYLFVTDENEKVAYFSTGRYAPPNKIDVLKVNTERIPLDVAVLKGTVVKENNTQSVNSKITVKNMDNGETLGPFIAENNGNYNMQLPNGGKFIFTVETPGLETQSDRVALPMATTLKPLKQTISYDNKILKIINYFDEVPADDSYVQYMKLIEEKAKLDVKGTVNPTPTPTLVSSEPPVVTNTTSTKTEPENKSTPTVTSSTPAVTTNTVATITKTQTTAPVTNTSPVKTDVKKGIDNKALIDIAKKDADEARSEAIQLTNDANDAKEIASQKRIEANQLDEQAKLADESAEKITNAEEKKMALERAAVIRKEAQSKKETAAIIEDLAKSLEADAEAKQKELILNEQYTKVLEEASAAGSNKQALEKLENVQKQMEAIGATKNLSNDKYTAIKQSIEEKEKEVAKSQEQLNDKKANKEEVEVTIKSKEEDLAKAKRKEKKGIEEEIAALKTELIAKEAQYQSALAENKKQTEELEDLKSNLDLVNRIKNEAVTTPITSLPNASGTGTAIATNTSTNSGSVANEKVITNTALKEKYASAISSNEDPQALKSKIQEINDYNAAIKDAIAVNKAELNKAKQPADKNKIAAEIKALEKQKQENDRLIAKAKSAGNDGATSLAVTKEGNGTNSTTPKANTIASEASGTITSVAVNTTVPAQVQNETSISAENPEGFKQSAARIQNQINASESKAVYNFNDYRSEGAKQSQGAVAAQLKQIEEKEKALKESLIALTEKVSSRVAAPNGTVLPVSEMAKQGDDLMAQARTKRNEAKDKQGIERENILSEAKQLETQANEKYLEAAKETKRLKQDEMSVNSENLEGLIQSGKASQLDLQAVNNLKTEIEQLSKQAAEIRSEADAQANYGAKLGAMSNAEEKENEIIQKQQQALVILTKTNPTYPLKKTEAAAAKANAPLPKEDIERVNAQINDLNKEKIVALANVVQANNEELKLQNQLTNAQNKQLTANPALKKEWNAIKQEQRVASDLLNKANQSNSLTERVALTEEAAKKQQEIISRQTVLNEQVKQAQVAATATDGGKNNSGKTNTEGNTADTKENTTIKETTVATKTATNTGTKSETKDGGTTTVKSATAASANTETKVGTNDGGTSTVKTGTTGTSTEPNTETKDGGTSTVKTGTTGTSTEPKTETKDGNNSTVKSGTSSASPVSTNVNLSYTVDVNQLNNPDSTFSSISKYFDSNNIALKNAGANAMKEKALADLKANNENLNNLANEPAATTATAASGSTLSVVQLSASVTRIEAEADELNKQARVKREEANTKKGKEKEGLLAEAKNLESSALSKQVEAAQLMQQVNEGQYQANTLAISDLLNKAKIDQLAQYPRLEQNAADIEKIRKEAKALREEATKLTNDAARLGAIENAEEKETDLLQKQKVLLEDLKQAYPSYVVKTAEFTNDGNVNAGSEEKNKKQNELVNKQFEALTSLTNAYNLEYETNKTALPKKLSPDQQTIKQKADVLSTESKRLLIQGSKTASKSDKTKLYTQAAKSSSEAVKLLNTIAPVKETTTNNPSNTVVAGTQVNTSETKQATNKNNDSTNKNANTKESTNQAIASKGTTNGGATAPEATNTSPKNAANTKPAVNNATTGGTGTLKVEGLEVIKGNAYSDVKPIPIDEKMPDGLVFRVQIGAFKQQLPNSAFRGLTPVNGQTTGNGYTRYTIGNFNKYENANGVKNDMRNVGYNDAFVVAYFNGKKITLAEASDILKNEGKTIQPSSQQSAGITAKTNIPKAETILQAPNAVSEQVVVTKELEQTKDLLYTVQIGVYSKQVTKAQLGNLKPIYTEQLPSGLYRYTAGIYNKTEKIIEDKNRVVNGIGIKDAFTTAYLNGKRIAFAEARLKQQTDTSIRMEAQNPIVFPESGVIANQAATVVNTATTNASPGNTNTTPVVTPFSNGVTKAPDPTPENGVKVGEEGVVFKVQIGAYSRQVPNDVAAKFLNIKTWPIENKQIKGLYIYNIGNFTAASFAKKLREEAISVGITDAFITVYKDGQKLTGAEAAALLNK